jgi:hypothetical protein
VPVLGEDGAVTGWENKVIDFGVNDKRLLCVETEFGKTLIVSGREGNSLPGTHCSLWEDGTAEILTKKPLRATDAHVSIIGHVTPIQLLTILSQNRRTEMDDGFANRFLWAWVKDTKDLPGGGATRRWIAWPRRWQPH